MPDNLKPIDPIEHFLDATRSRLDEDADTDTALGRELATFSSLLQEVAGKERQVESETPPGLRHLDAALAEARSGACADLAATLEPVARRAYWTRFYADDHWTREFRDEFANGELVGPEGPLVSDRVILGAFVLGPHTLYPSHAHPAVEIYLPLTCEAEFDVAWRGFKAVPPGAYSLHPSDVQHAIRTGERPLLALFAWRGELLSPSWYFDARGERREPPRLSQA